MVKAGRLRIAILPFLLEVVAQCAKGDNPRVSNE
jgi:hypothetical protein